MTNTNRTVAAGLFAVLAFAIIAFVQPDAAQACGTYGMDDETLVEWAVFDHVDLRTAQAHADRDASSPAPQMNVDRVEVFAGRLAVAQVTITENGTARMEFYTVVKNPGKDWQVIGSTEHRS